ncbi:MAG: glycerophosphoryl diester phosphodiesterase membrane domain-containing protein [Isosphaeraceae bacterium]|nr:glycerophosphoryl diester phosphodiesterase membrane domain-containing protein [Isosphaeraceae bacterium]
MVHDPAFDDHDNPYAAPTPEAQRQDEFAPWDYTQPIAGRVRFEVLSEAWDLLKAQPWNWILIYLVFLLCTQGIGFVINQVFQIGLAGLAAQKPSRSVLIAAVVVGFLAIFLINIAITAFFRGGLFRAACKQIRGEPFGVKDLFGASRDWPALLQASILIALGTFAGALCFIIPGIIVATRWMLTLPLIADGHLPATEAMRRSWHAIKGQTLLAFALNFVAGLLSVLGVLLCCVGVLFTGPLYTLAIALVYRDHFLTKFKPPAWVEPI